MSFDDYLKVEIDPEEGMFYITKENGRVFPYDVEVEKDLLDNIKNSSDTEGIVFVLYRIPYEEWEEGGAFRWY